MAWEHLRGSTGIFLVVIIIISARFVFVCSPSTRLRDELRRTLFLHSHAQQDFSFFFVSRHLSSLQVGLVTDRRVSFSFAAIALFHVSLSLALTRLTLWQAMWLFLNGHTPFLAISHVLVVSRVRYVVLLFGSHRTRCAEFDMACTLVDWISEAKGSDQDVFVCF
jgi:hypothetical protein